MKIDLFEGGRRLALIISILISLSTFAALQPLDNTPSFYWEISDLGAKPVKIKECADRSITRFIGSNKIAAGAVYNAYLCFLLHDSADGTSFGIPFKSTPDGKSAFIGTSGMPGVSEYMDATGAAFRLIHDDVHPSKTDIWFATGWEFAKKLGIAVLAFLASIMIFKIIGWIFKGFIRT